MTKPQTYELAEKFYQMVVPTAGPVTKAINWLFGTPPESAAETLLAKYLPHRFAIHNADLLDDERRRVEEGLADGEIDVVFATSTLAAGVNFPLASAVFHAWSRRDQATKTWKPIDGGEFHNMAGRVGRMGLTEDSGLVVFVATHANDVRAGVDYLDFEKLMRIEPRIGPAHFETIVLQLVSSGFCSSVDELYSVLTSTFSGVVEQDRNKAGLAVWRDALSAAVVELRDGGFVVTG